MRLIPTISLILLSLLLAGCGFHLRQENDINTTLAAMEIECDVQSAAICDLIESRLDNHAKRNQSTSKLSISGLTLSEKTKSIDAKARAAEIEVNRRLKFSLSAQDTQSDDREIRSRQILRYEEENILAKEREKKEIIDALNKDLANKIIRQVNRIISQANNK